MVGTTATIVMPAHANEFKVAATRRYGGTPVLTDRHLADVMTEIANAEKRVVIHPFDDMRIIAGAAGVGLELIDDAPPLDLVVVPVGGGGLVSGVAAAVKLRSPSTPLSATCRSTSSSMWSSFFGSKGKMRSRTACQPAMTSRIAGQYGSY